MDVDGCEWMWMYRDEDIWDRNQIGDGIIEFSILGGCEI